MSYREFFETITGNTPFPYQQRLAEGSWPQVLDIPTGLGKTAAVVGGWLWRRLQRDEHTGRRLVYCLPMRVLVDQTVRSAEGWCEHATSAFKEAGMAAPTVHSLMGGLLDESWEGHPEQDAVLVGTQDMLLSRALNRGYAMTSYRWPMHFALLNNDCLWVLDETQLVGVGIETSAQLQAFREKLGSHASSRTLWMSATLGGKQLSTVDHPEPPHGWITQTLTGADTDDKLVQQRTGAAKPIQKLEGVRLDKQSDAKSYVDALANRVRAEHEARGGLTLVIMNRVTRAQALFEALRRPISTGEAMVGLVHSRFRRSDRSREETMLQDDSSDRIVVATQAVEAGVDVSARTMFTELAPWPALVQRFGRCNRYGDEDAAILWADIDTSDDKSGLELPYEVDELRRAGELLNQLHEMGADAGPQRLRKIQYEPPPIIRPVLRRRDLLDLFDTTPDLSGNDIDVSRYVRDGSDTDLQFYWRDYEREPDDTQPPPEPEELCRVSIAASRDFLKKLGQRRKKLAGAKPAEQERARNFWAWRWNPLDRAWESVTTTFPGQVLLLHPEAGGYDTRLGWTGEVAPKHPTPPTASHTPDETFDDALDSDGRSFIGRWVRLPDHLAHVRDEAATLADALDLADVHGPVLSTAGLWHDVGKAHPVFQDKLLRPVEAAPSHKPDGEGPWAKSNHRLRTAEQRKHFRHELASALAWLQEGDAADDRFRNLVAYLVAAHHGKVRLSIRSLPDETQPQDEERLFARGVWQGDTLEDFALPDGRRLEGIELDLSVMQLGEGSWLERMLRLRDAGDLGPFRLALLETVVRVADWRASQKEQEGLYDET